MTLPFRLALLLPLLLAVLPAGAQPPVAAQCQTPADLLASDVRLDQTAAALAAGRPLRVLVLGTATSGGMGASSVAAAYPARLDAALAALLPGRPIQLTVVAESGRTAAQQATQMPALMARLRPHLVVWQTGTVDAWRGLDLAEFANAIMTGAIETEVGQADLLLVQPQYGSRAEPLRDIGPYLEAMEQTARGRGVLLFRRHAVMRHWVENGQINLAAPGRAEQLVQADRVHACVGQVLAGLIVAATK